jgi:hypothetical protein
MPVVHMSTEKHLSPKVSLFRAERRWRRIQCLARHSGYRDSDTGSAGFSEHNRFRKGRLRKNCNMSDMNTASTLADNESSSEGQSGLKRFYYYNLII